MLKYLVIVLSIKTVCLAKLDDTLIHRQIHFPDTTATSFLRSQIEDGLCYWKVGDYNQAERCFRLAADHKYSWGQYNLALCYFHGKGVAKDLVKAASLMRLASSQGNQEAQSALGSMYCYGLGVEKNYEEALKWYQLAAKAGNTTAYTYIGYLYEFGLGVPQNYYMAYEWYQKAADKGSGDAMQCLGGLYENGKGVEKNINEALKWYRAAAEQSLPEACYRAFRIYYYDLLDTVNSYNYLARAAAQNHVAALYELAEAYYLGLLGRSIDKQKAFQYYQKAANSGSSLAHMALKNRTFSSSN
ncbi:SEL1-like repeat protein [Spirosoma arboris]|nr:SEL1-like repeat protein [Spirosoma arboris]